MIRQKTKDKDDDDLGKGRGILVELLESDELVALLTEKVQVQSSVMRVGELAQKRGESTDLSRAGHEQGHSFSFSPSPRVLFSPFRLGLPC